MPRAASERVPAHEAGCDGEAGPCRGDLNAKICSHPVRNQARGRDWTMRGTRPPTVTACDCRLALGQCLLKFISLASRRPAAGVAVQHVTHAFHQAIAAWTLSSVSRRSAPSNCRYAVQGAKRARYGIGTPDSNFEGEKGLLPRFLGLLWLMRKGR